MSIDKNALDAACAAYEIANRQGLVAYCLIEAAIEAYEAAKVEESSDSQIKSDKTANNNQQPHELPWYLRNLFHEKINSICEDETHALDCADKIVALISESHQPVELPCSDDILEAVINEHDLNVPEGLLASPAGFGAHREAMKAALAKIIPLTLHIEAEYNKATKRESGVNNDVLAEELQANGLAWGAQKNDIADYICRNFEVRRR